MKICPPLTAAHMKLKSAAFLFLVLFFYGWASDAKTSLDTAADALREHVRYLASEHLAGRGVGDEGIRLARDYIAREFTRYGLKPAGENGSYFQTFEVTTGAVVAEPTSLALGEDS
jgi:hypothetical protein